MEILGRLLRAVLDWFWRWVSHHIGRRSGRLVLLVRRSVTEFLEDNCLHLAGSVAYHVLLSILPMVILVVSVSDLLVDPATVRHTVVDTVATYIPLTSDGHDSLVRLLARLQQGSSAVGLIGLFGVLISAGGMMSAVRTALNLAWGVSNRRAFLRGKGMDMLLLLGAGVLLGLSVALTVLVKLAAEAGADVLGPLLGHTRWLVGLLVPLLLSFIVFAVLYRVVPAQHRPLREIWPGALTGAVLFQLLKEGFAEYLEHFSRYNELYGSLGSVAAFILFVYLSAIMMLFGAEVASEYPQLPARVTSDDLAPG